MRILIQQEEIERLTLGSDLMSAEGALAEYQ
jgi:hypothetical protein